MKKIFVMAALAMAAISCTKSDVLDSPVLNQGISFNTYLGKAPVSKATVQDNESVMEDYSFSVKAIKYYPGTDEESEYVKDTKNPVYMDRDLSHNGSNWVYDGNLVYWPTDGAALRFIAFGNNVNPTTTTTTNFALIGDSQTEYTYTVPAELADQQDLIVATTDILGTEEEKPAVGLNFKHLLSRIGFSLTSNATVPVHISELKIVGDFYTTATIDLLDETVSEELELAPVIDANAPKQESYDIIKVTNTFTPEFTTTTETNDSGEQQTITTPKKVSIYDRENSVTEENRFLMIIPQGATKIIGKYTLGDDETVRPIEILMEGIEALSEGFLPGKAYEFVLNVKADVISFSVNVTGWDEISDFTENI